MKTLIAAVLVIVATGCSESRALRESFRTPLRPHDKVFVTVLRQNTTPHSARTVFFDPGERISLFHVFHKLDGKPALSERLSVTILTKLDVDTVQTNMVDVAELLSHRTPEKDIPLGDFAIVVIEKKKD